jgi:hypothetical protein
MAQEPDAGIDLDVGADASRTVGDLGPNDAADWGAANYFSGTYNFWSNRSYNSVTQWSSGYYDPYNMCIRAASWRLAAGMPV